jgi:hypothetical protein
MEQTKIEEGIHTLRIWSKKQFEKHETDKNIRRYDTKRRMPGG